MRSGRSAREDDDAGLQAADGGDAANTQEVGSPDGGADVSQPQIKLCADLNVSSLTDDNVEALIQQYQGLACVEELPDGDRAMSWECRYGRDLFVCGNSSGLKLLNRSCIEGKFECQSGLTIQAQQEAISCPPSDGGNGDGATSKIERCADVSSLSDDNVEALIQKYQGVA